MLVPIDSFIDVGQNSRRIIDSNGTTLLCLLSCTAMADKELKDSIKTIQQLLVEYGVLFGGGPMDSADDDNAYAEVGYENLLENHLNIGGFVGFNFGTFHKNMLQFWYHQYEGIFVDEQSMYYIEDFEKKLIDSIQTGSLFNKLMHDWMLWSVSILSKVVLILNQYFSMTISSYREEDKNRVTLLVWELVLSKFDAIDGPIDKTWTASLRQDIRFAYMKYHSNINYVVDIKIEALHITDTTMLRITGPFDDPPDSSRIRSRFVSSPSQSQVAMSASSTTTSSQLQHTMSLNSVVPTSSLSPAVQQEPLHPIMHLLIE